MIDLEDALKILEHTGSGSDPVWVRGVPTSVDSLPECEDFDATGRPADFKLEYYGTHNGRTAGTLLSMVVDRVSDDLEKFTLESNQLLRKLIRAERAAVGVNLRANPQQAARLRAARTAFRTHLLMLHGIARCRGNNE